MPIKTKKKGPEPDLRLKKVSSILVSQPKPERSPYYEIETKYGTQIDWRPFIQVDGLSEKEFRKQKIRPNAFPCVVFTSRTSIEHYFRLCEEMRLKVSEMTKYFCTTETVANYLQKFILFRKRKVFSGTKNLVDIANYFQKHKESGVFLIPCSDVSNVEVIQFLKSSKVKFQEAIMHRTVNADLSDLKDIKYDVLVFFSPMEIKSLFDNFPDFVQGDTRIAVFGPTAAKAAKEAGLIIDIQAPTPATPSMAMALEEYIKKTLG
ncbi:MAG: uroporphyrinogen-III synthase [Saprospiraceae bacterium]|jgi:uroporphyrinogen-III synthase|nr:uroporphyrinogen-III synthase [Saprospiraceae bacterium]MBK7468040.1 uroporphyrinogen-III synthase [Saprospiraceae bacterium]MBK8623824.1 uroporphyrinogen-III synthase [Saprospiraceae bacterium]MBK9994375.1 uroporphyrinogen-III synthase [Saprospiraceae bacterium]